MITLLLIILKVLNFVHKVSGLDHEKPDLCSGGQQKNIMESMSECSTRPTLVDLRRRFSNNSDVIQVVPDHVTVNRCGGSCYVPPHSCNPTKETVMTVQVMLVLSKWPHGEHETLCTEVEVEVHHECQCGCQIQQDQCLPDLQYYHQPSCRCICRAVHERNSCILDGKVWDPHTCQCHCPVYSWQYCSTGYMYDYSNTCSCVQIFAVASKGLQAAVILLAVSTFAVVVGGVLVARNRRDGKVGQARNTFQRTPLMSQISKGEFDNVESQQVKLTGKPLSLDEFDLNRNREI